MKCIDELKKIGIDKISAKTRITQEKVQDIIDFKFEAFDRVRALGFTQIITRDFGVDLSEWFDAYNEHCNANTEKEAENSSNEDNINIAVDSDKKDKSYVVLALFLIVLVVFFMGFFIYNNFLSVDSSKGTKNANKSNATHLQEIQRQNKVDLVVKDSVQNTIDSANQNIDSGIDSSANQSTNLNETKNSPNNSVNSNANPSVNITVDSANNGNSQGALATNIVDYSLPANATQGYIATHREELTIMPNEPLWVGVIDLKTRRKKQISIDSQYSLPLDGDKIIRTGHSYFSISSGTNFAKQYIGGDNKYFLYRVDGGLREINKAEFLELNKGEEW